MMRTTGGSAVGDTSTRSSSAAEAICSASKRDITPACDPSAAITRSCGALISSLRRTRFVALAIRQPSQHFAPATLELDAEPFGERLQIHRAQILAAKRTH